MRRGTNLPRMGDFNQSVILDAIRRSDAGLSRVELAQVVGLAPQTISNIVRRLLAAGLIVEDGKTSTGNGKPRTILRAHAAGSYAVGVHLDPAVTTAVLLDLQGTVVARRVLETPLSNSPDRVIAAISGQVENLITGSGVDRSLVLGLGVAVPGPIDEQTGTVLDPPNLLGWHRVPLRHALMESTGLPVLIEKDVVAAASGEVWVSGRNMPLSFIFVYIGTGIGCGIALEGTVLRGVSGNAGEIGHLVTDSSGPLCTCGQRGCLAVTCTPPGLVSEAQELGILPRPTELPNGADLTSSFLQLCAAAGRGHAGAAELLDRGAARTAHAVAVLSAAFDVDQVIFGGPFWAPLARRYLDVVPTVLQNSVVPRGIERLEVLSSRVGDDATAVGGACLILDETLGPRPDRLLLGS